VRLKDGEFFMIEVDQRQLGATGIKVPALGIGTWSWGDKGFWGYGKAYTRDDIMQSYRFCLDNGLYFFDTAEVYGKGESERLLGEARREDGRPIVIASKFAPLPQRFSAKTLLEALDNSLERLGVKQIDLYQIHFPYTILSIDSLMDALAEAVHSEKVRAVGVSNYSAKQLRRAHARLARHDIPLASNQVHYNLLHRKPEANGVLDACRELDIALIAYSPLEQGLLTGKYRHGDTPLPSLSRRLASQFGRDKQEKMEPLFVAMDEVAHAHDKTLAQVALNWLLKTDVHIIPIPGAKTLRQAQENAGALGWSLNDVEYARIAQAAQPWLHA
jgi:aryl-alcohol dehydrogenase-like predicted oxidoreductase